MARSLQDIRRKMKAIKSTRQVTKALELVSGSKMRKAVAQAVQLREYANLSWEILQRIAARVSVDDVMGAHPALVTRPVQRVLGIMFTSDRGLCGSLHTQLFRMATQHIRELESLATFEKIDFVAVGRKGQQYLLRNGRNVIAAFPALSNRPTFRDVLPIKKLAADEFLKGTYDHVVIFYTDFISPLRQDPTIEVLLPFSQTTLREMITTLMQDKAKSPRTTEVPLDDGAEYSFEPSASAVLEAIIPQLTDIQVFQAVLEAAASEHSARMVAMKNASDNASDILEDLTLTYNQTRQEKITGELAELSASKAALD